MNSNIRMIFVMAIAVAVILGFAWWLATWEDDD